MEWESILADAANDGTIRELHLSKVPVLKTTNNWKEVKVLGWVDFKMKHSHYKGVLVKLNDKLYFVKRVLWMPSGGILSGKLTKKFQLFLNDSFIHVL